VSLFAKELKSVALLLERVVFYACSAVDFEFLSQNFYALALTLRGYKLALHMDAGTCSDRLEVFFREVSEVEDDLKVFDSRAIVEGYKLHVLVATASAHPTLNVYFFADQAFAIVEEVDYTDSFDIFHLYVLYK
jgi:hypothetical protein